MADSTASSDAPIDAPLNVPADSQVDAPLNGLGHVPGNPPVDPLGHEPVRVTDDATARTAEPADPSPEAARLPDDLPAPEARSAIASRERLMPSARLRTTHTGLPLSAVFEALAARHKDNLKVGEITRALRDRGFSAVMILLCLPNLVPMPPGVSTLFGLPLMLVALQLLSGYKRPFLPARVRAATIPGETFGRLAARVVPWLRWIERLARPRWWLLPQVVAERVVGALVLLMALILILPIPGANFVPALAAVVMCLGLGERDGLWAGGGVLLAVLALGVTIGILSIAGLAMHEII